MIYRVEYTVEAVKALKKIDKPTQALIFGWITKHLVGCLDPRKHGKSLVANHSGKWRYRVGNYRILAEIRDSEVLILVLTVGHRKNVYK